MANIYKNSGKVQELPVAEFKDAVVLDPKDPYFQPRSAMPNNPDFVGALKRAGGWDRDFPAKYLVRDSKPVIVDGNRRQLAAQELSGDPNWAKGFYQEVKLSAETASGLNLARDRSNISSKSDPWTEAETYANRADPGKGDLLPEEIAAQAGESVTRVRRLIKLHNAVITPPAPPAEESEKQRELRIKRHAERSYKIAQGIRSGDITWLSVEKILERDMDEEALDKATRKLLLAKKEAGASGIVNKQAETLADLTELGIPKKFFGAFRAEMASSSHSPGLTETQRSATLAAMDVIMGILPRKQFLAGDFIVHKKAEGDEAEEVDGKESAEDEETDESKETGTPESDEGSDEAAPASE